jgi:hypothetical protein
LNVLVDPLQRESLIFQSQVPYSSIDDIVAIQEAKRSETIRDACSNNWFTDLDRVINDEGEIVTSVRGPAIVEATA